MTSARPTYRLAARPLTVSEWNHARAAVAAAHFGSEYPPRFVVDADALAELSADLERWGQPIDMNAIPASLGEFIVLDGAIPSERESRSSAARELLATLDDGDDE